MTLTREKLAEWLHYNPESGIFTWPMRRSGVRCGHAAGWVSDEGYIMIGLLGSRFRAHHLAWLWMTGEWPADQIDHKNTIRTDNRWSNLREADAVLNAQNLRHAKSNNKSTGVLGVSADGRRFQAKIVVDGERHYLGRFDTAEEAHRAYVDAKRRLHPGCTI